MAENQVPHGTPALALATGIFDAMIDDRSETAID